MWGPRLFATWDKIEGVSYQWLGCRDSQKAWKRDKDKLRLLLRWQK